MQMESEIKAPEIQKMETKSRAGITKQEYKLRAKNVDVFYNNFQAIHNISMDIVDKSVTAFIGPSGCGKSTFLRLFNLLNDYIDGFTMNGQICLGDHNFNYFYVRVDVLR